MRLPTAITRRAQPAPAAPAKQPQGTDAERAKLRRQRVAGRTPATQQPAHRSPIQRARQAYTSTNPRLRTIAFNSTAAATGYALGLVNLLGYYLPAAEQAAIGMTGLLLAITAAVAAWRFTRLQSVASVLPYAMVSRVIVTALAAELGRRLAPAAVAALDQYGASWGLGSQAASLLVTSTAMCGGLWWLTVRRIRARGWVRWITRVPLASAVLAIALYAPGTLA